MAMDFWQAKRRAKKQTIIYFVLFALLTLVAAILLEVGMRYYAGSQYDPPGPLFGLSFLAVTFLAAFVQYICYKAFGGKFVAESMGGYLADKANGAKEAQLINIVEEIALASSLPIPKVYVINAEEINAFAAGLTPESSVIAVTRGSLERLSRDEMQGVIAHEFGHIANGDMMIGLRLAAMLMGFYFVLYFGLRILQFSSYSRRRGSNPVLVAALFFVVAGAFAWFFGSLLKAAVSRQREYLADASSVQFTRNPTGLANALRKIQDETVRDMPRTGMAYSHLYFDHRSLFATHPPLEKRIQAIEEAS